MQIDKLTTGMVAGICDHTFLARSEAFEKEADLKGVSAVRLREKSFHAFLEATSSLSQQPYSICIRPEDVHYARVYLDNNRLEGVKIASVVGFPDGQWYPTLFKVSETKLAIASGADEIDMVMDYDRLKNGELDAVHDDMRAVIDAAHKESARVKVILETSELSHAQIAIACKIADECGADFVKTSTGFGSGGARVDDLRVMRKNFPRGIKMSGGVKPWNFKELLNALSDDGEIELDPMKVRIGESTLISGGSGY